MKSAESSVHDQPENQIHPTAVIGRQVRLGKGNVIGPNVVLAGAITIGDDNWFGANVVIGCPPEVRGFPHGADWIDVPNGPGVHIGHKGVFREGAQVHAGWHEKTRIGNEVFIMNQVYIGHDGHIANQVTMASNVACGGHVHIGFGANLGLGTVVHQRRVIGALAMVGMGSVVTRDMPPFVKAFGNPCRVQGINSVGMERNGVTASSIELVTQYLAEGRSIAELDAPDLSPFIGPITVG